MLGILKRHPYLSTLVIVMATIALFLATLVVGVVLLFSRPRGIPPIPSPDGTVLICPYLIGTSTIVDFELRGPKNQLLFRDTTDASDVMRWEFRWEDNDTFVMGSSDIGTVRWRRDSSGNWTREGREQVQEVESP